MKAALAWRILAAFLIVAVVANGTAQQGVVLSKKAVAIKHKVESLAPHSQISVIRVHGGEEFGELLANDQEGFTFHDIDRDSDVTLKYGEVRKVKSGYGGYNPVRERHTDRTRNMVVIVAVMGALGALIGAAAAKN